MADWYFVLAPLAVLAVLLLFRFTGCGAELGGGGANPNAYHDAVTADGPVAYFRLREKSGDTVANELGSPGGSLGAAVSPLLEGDPNWRSTAVANTGTDLGITDPRLVQNDFTSDYSAIRFHGGFVQVPPSVPLNTLTEFTVELLVFPDWDVSFALGKYYCALESADFVTVQGQPPPQQKDAGFGIYAGPDDPTNPLSPYHWQVWMGSGAAGFQRLVPKPFVNVPGNPVPNPGPTVQPEPTYLAFTFSQSLNLAFLYTFTPSRDLDYTTYELTPVPYLQAAQSLFIGMAAEGPLFTPFISAGTLLYPFRGLIGEVAIYDKVLDEGRLRNHVLNNFFF